MLLIMLFWRAGRVLGRGCDFGWDFGLCVMGFEGLCDGRWGRGGIRVERRGGDRGEREETGTRTGTEEQGGWGVNREEGRGERRRERGVWSVGGRRGQLIMGVMYNVWVRQ